MTDEKRLIQLREACSLQEIDQALNGYHAEILQRHSRLRFNYAFNLALERKQYLHALCDIKRASRGLFGDAYRDLIPVLELAASKQSTLSDGAS